MGDVIEFPRGRSRPRRTMRRAAEARPRKDDAAATFFFDLASPQTYLVAERIERWLGKASWRPAYAPRFATVAPPGRQAAEHARADVERRAGELRVPLIWPEPSRDRLTAAMRVADYALENDRCAAFAIAAGRLAYCGGFDLDDQRTLAEAAAAAGLDVRGALAAARDQRRDRANAAAGRALWTGGATVLPALRLAGRIVCGERRITAAWLAGPHISAHPSAS